MGLVGREMLFRRLDGAGNVEANAADLVSQARATPGAPLDAGSQAMLDMALCGRGDVSRVRVHDDARSHAAARAVGARAFAIGSDIYFAAGQYDPTSKAGQHLIAHEVAHTLQQEGAAPHVRRKRAISAPGDACEREADAFADAVVAGAPAPALRASADAALLRKESPAPARGQREGLRCGRHPSRSLWP